MRSRNGISLVLTRAVFVYKGASLPTGLPEESPSVLPVGGRLPGDSAEDLPVF